MVILDGDWQHDPDSSKAKRDLGFKLTVPIEEGMRRTVEWFKAVHSCK